MESEFAYFQRRALEERQWGLAGLTPSAREAHLTMAEHLESMARAIHAQECRRCFHDVNAAASR